MACRPAPVRGGACGPARARGARPVGGNRPASERGLAAQARALAKARPRHPSLRLSLGRRSLLHSPARARTPVPLLVLIGADASGRKELLAIEDGFRESAQSWRELLLRLRDENGLVLAPELATGDGALGFWQALHQVWPKTRQPRCWVHKAANVLNVLPKSLHGKAKQDLHAIYEAANRKEAELAFDHFVGKYGSKYDKAVACLAKDREPLLAFYAAPAEHWKHIRTTNPIERTFATVRLRTDKTKGCLSRQTALAMDFKLAKSAEGRWRCLDGSERLGQLIEGLRFRDGEPLQAAEEQAAA